MTAEDSPQRRATLAAGAHGLTLAGELAPDGPGQAYVAAPAHWPAVALSWCHDDGEVPPAHLGEQHARLPLLDGGWVEVQRDPVTATFHTPTRPTADWVAHPGLASSSALASWWTGREAFHGGAVVLGDGAWGVLGGKEAGKSTLLAYLALAGAEVVADDLLVIADGRALAGHRGIDLREPTADRLPPEAPTAVVRHATRTRLRLQPTAAEQPLAGWLLLTDGPRVALANVPPSERLARLGSHRSVRRASTAPVDLLDLLRLPLYELQRPRSWAALDETVDLIARELG